MKKNKKLTWTLSRPDNSNKTAREKYEAKKALLKKNPNTKFSIEFFTE